MAYANYSEYKQKNPTSTVTKEDEDLISNNADFATNWLKYKSQYDDNAGNTAAQTAANKSMNDMRTYYGGYTGGADGSIASKYANDLSTGTKSTGSVFSTLNSQLNGVTGRINSGTNAAVEAQRKQQDLLRYNAKKQNEDVTAGYYSGLSALNENTANQGYSPLGGQSRTERASALSQMTQAQNTVTSQLQSDIAASEMTIGQLLQEGAYKAAEQEYNNLQTLLAQDQLAKDNQYRNETFDYSKQQDAINNSMNEAGLTGQYNGNPTMTAQQWEWQKYLDQQNLKAAQAKVTASTKTPTLTDEDVLKNMNSIFSLYEYYRTNKLDIPENVQNMYDMYFGSDSPTPYIVTNQSSNLASIDSSVNSALQQGMTPRIVATLLDEYVTNGKLSESEAESLAAKYGII